MPFYRKDGLKILQEKDEKMFFRRMKSDLISFEKSFPDEKTCEKRLHNFKWAGGYRCPRCDHEEYYYHSTRGLYQCKKCGYQASLRSGTIFDKSKTPLKLWFHMIFVLCLSNNEVPISGLMKYRREYMGRGDYRRSILKMAKKITEINSETNNYCVLVKAYPEDEKDDFKLTQK